MSLILSHLFPFKSRLFRLDRFLFRSVFLRHNELAKLTQKSTATNLVISLKCFVVFVPIFFHFFKICGCCIVKAGNWDHIQTLHSIPNLGMEPIR